MSAFSFMVLTLISLPLRSLSSVVSSPNSIDSTSAAEAILSVLVATVAVSESTIVITIDSSTLKVFSIGSSSESRAIAFTTPSLSTETAEPLEAETLIFVPVSFELIFSPYWFSATTEVVTSLPTLFLIATSFKNLIVVSLAASTLVVASRASSVKPVQVTV